MTLRVSCVSGRSPAGCQEKKAAKKVLVELSFVWKSERILNFSPPKELGDRASELRCRLGAAVCAGGRGQSPLRAGGPGLPLQLCCSLVVDSKLRNVTKLHLPVLCQQG